MSNAYRGLVVLLLGVATIGGCGGSTHQAAADAAETDLQPTGDVASSPADTGVGGGDGSSASPDGGMAMDGPTYECAPTPTAGPSAAGTTTQQAAGAAVVSTTTRPQLTQAAADAQYTVRKVLAQGGALTAPTNTADPTTYGLNDNWDPVTNGIGDPSTFTPMYTVAIDGSGTHTTLKAAFTDAIALGLCSRVYIRLMAGTYREQVILASKTSAPPITLYSTEADATKTTIVFNASAATAGNMSSSATLTVKALWGFQMKNLTVANDYVEGSASGNDQSAVAFLNQADRSQFENVRIAGNIASLYVKSVDPSIAARSYFRDSYVEGDQDVILGRGTAVFDHTEIKILSGRQTTGGAIAYPSTLVYNHYGFLFDSCKFTAEVGATGILLGHQWNESAAAAAVGKIVIRNSTLGGHIAAEPWSALGGRVTTPKNPAGATPILVYTSDDYYAAGTGPTPPESFLAEYGNTGAGAAR